MRTTELPLDGTDQTAKLREVLSRVPAGDVLTIGAGTILIEGEVSIPTHIKGIRFEGTNVVIDARTKRSGFLWRNAAGTFGGANITINGDFEHQGAGLYCLDADGLTIDDLTFNSPDNRIQRGRAIHIMGRAKAPKDINIFNVTVYGKIGTTKDTPVMIRIEGELKGNSRDYWKANHQGIRSPYPVKDVVLKNVTVDGGYYGLQFTTVDSSQVELCTFRNNTRGISLQEGSSFNRIRWNTIADNVSAGIHMAYGSNWNEVSFNMVTSSLARGEGMIQAYVGSSNNIITGNTTIATKGAEPKYHLYTAVMSDKNQLTDNNCIGGWARSCIGVESDWDSTLPYPYHRAFNAPDDDHYASEGMSGVLVAGNKIMDHRPNPVLLSAVGDHPLSVFYKDIYQTTIIGQPSVM